MILSPECRSSPPRGNITLTGPAPFLENFQGRILTENFREQLFQEDTVSDLSTINYVYIRDQRGNRRGVVAYVVGEGRLRLGASFCADNDTFDREIGKLAARSRLNVDPWDIPQGSLGGRNTARRALAEAVGGRQGDTVSGMPSWLGSSQTARGLVRRMLKQR